MAVGAALVLGAGACASPQRSADPVELGGEGASPSPTATSAEDEPARRGDPRQGGFEMEAEGENDSSGPGSGDEGFKIERPSFRPGQTIRIPLNLAAGVYKIECWVANHDDLGMEILLEVRPDAPKVRQAAADGGNDVAIQGFAFDPEELPVAPGTEVTWTNEDPEAHTVTAEDGSFDSGPIEPGRSFSVQVGAAGRISYICEIHPSMTASLQVG